MDRIVRQFGAGVPDVDCFATGANARFPRYWDLKNSAWEHSWRPEHAGLLWINPPFNMIHLVVKKLKSDSAKEVVIVPE